jgi:hypothetical protein
MANCLHAARLAVSFALPSQGDQREVPKGFPVFLIIGVRKFRDLLERSAKNDVLLTQAMGAGVIDLNATALLARSFGRHYFTARRTTIQSCITFQACWKSSFWTSSWRPLTWESNEKLTSPEKLHLTR